MFTGERNLWENTREEGYNDYLEAQRLLGEFRKDKALKKIKLVDGLLKDKQSWVYVPQLKLRILIFKKIYHTTIAGHWGEKLRQSNINKVVLAEAYMGKVVWPHPPEAERQGLHGYWPNVKA